MQHCVKTIAIEWIEGPFHKIIFLSGVSSVLWPDSCAEDKILIKSAHWLPVIL